MVMTLIKCPKCGQTVLSVATSCPKCRYLLTQNPMQQGWQSDLVECRRCGKMIARATVVCEFCDYPVRQRRKLRRVAFWGVAAAAVIVVAIAAYRMQAGTRPITATSGEAEPSITAIPIPATPSPEPRVAEGEPRPDALGGRPPTRPPIRAARPTAEQPLAPPAAGLPPSAHTRWTTQWANVRIGRDTLSAILRVVPPGTALVVGDQRGGWWAVYVDGAAQGFVAGDLLTRERPDTTRGTAQ